MTEPVKIAKKYLGQREKPGNMGFIDPSFDKKMKGVGHQDTHAWCAYFSELVFKEAYPDKLKALDRLFSASAVTTFENFKKAGYEVSAAPKEGALVIWQHYENGEKQWQGHAGVVSEVVSEKLFKSIEGNTNASGGREGIEVAEKSRTTEKKPTGLNVLGFIVI